MKSREEIAKKYFPCTCGEIYLSRNLTAPDCAFHSLEWDKALEEYAQQSQPSGMRWVMASERLPVLPHPLPKDNIDERGILFVNRYHSAGAFWYPSYGVSALSFLENYNGWDVTEWEWLDESSPAGAAEGASEGMAEALAKFFAKECKVGDPLLSIIDSIYDDWKLVYDKLRIETSFSEAAIQANKFVIEKYASLSSPGSGWVKVDYTKPETLPEFGVDVIVYAPEEKDPVIIDHCFKGADGNVYWDWCNNPDTHKPTVTHWRPLPAPPGE